MESPIRLYQKQKDYQRHKLFRKIKRRRERERKNAINAPIKELRRRMKQPVRFRGGKDQNKGKKYGYDVEYMSEAEAMKQLADNMNRTAVMDEVVVTPSRRLPMQSELSEGITNQAANEKADEFANKTSLTPERFLGLMGANVPLAAGALGVTVAAPALFNSTLGPLSDYVAGSSIAGIPTTTWLDTALTSAFAGHGLNHVINEGIDGWGDAATTALEITPLGKLVKPISQRAMMLAKDIYENGILWDAYTTLGGRLGNYGDNLATNIYGTVARRFGLPDKARVPADAIRKIKGDVHVDNGVVNLTGNKPYFGNPHVNATLDRGVVSHSKGAWDGANTYITPARNFLEQTQGSLKSIEPSDMFSNGAIVTEAPQNVTLISGDVASLNKAREAGMQTLSSPRLRRIYQEEEAKYLAEKAAFDEQYANASGIQRLMLKAPESPKSKKWWPEYTKEVQRLQAQRGTPTLSDFRLLEEQTGLSSGTAPVSEMQNAVRQLEAMQNASISDIAAGRVQPYVYPNGRVVDWDKVAEELALIKRAKYNKVFYDPASYIESNWLTTSGLGYQKGKDKNLQPPKFQKGTDDNRVQVTERTYPDGSVRYFTGDVELEPVNTMDTDDMSMWTWQEKNRPYITYSGLGAKRNTEEVRQGKNKTAKDKIIEYSTIATDSYNRGKDIHIKPSKRGTFTAAAKKRGMSVQQFASKVLKAPKGKYSTSMRKKANFAKNASKWKK